jgi:hypothetical protein
MQHRRGEGRGNNQEIGLRIAPCKRRGSDSRNMPGDSREWQTLPLRSCPGPRGARPLSRLLTPLQCLTGAASCFSSPVDGGDAKADRLSFHRTETQRAPHAKAERNGAVEVEGGIGSGERREGRWAGSRGIFGQHPYACVFFFFEKEQMSELG